VERKKEQLDTLKKIGNKIDVVEEEITTNGVY
jgi:hypothetical protein